MAMEQTPQRKITLSYGGFAVVLLATLVIGLLSGAVLGGFATSWLLGRPALPTDMSGGPGRAWVGITYIPVTTAVARNRNLSVTKGALIIAVTPNSPASRAGLQADDIITAVEGRSIDANTSILDVIQTKKPGDKVTVTFLRGDREQTAEIVLGRLPLTPRTTPSETPLQRMRRAIDRLLEQR